MVEYTKSTPSAKILIVEDESMVSRSIKSQLRKMDLEVSGVAVSGEEALQLATSTRPDLVLMDIHLEGEIDGVEAARLIREALDIPVVYLTGFSDPETWQRARITGPFGYLFKPYDLQELQSTIELALNQASTSRILKESETRFRILTELTSDYAYILRAEPDGTLSVDWTTLDISPSLQRPTPYRMDSLDPLGNRIHPDDWSLMRQRLEKLLRGEPDVLEHRVITQANEVRWARDYARPIWDENHTCVQRIIGAVQDITERMRAEEALQQANQELSQYVFQLTQRNREATLLNEMGVLLLSCLNLSDVYNVLGDYLEKFFPVFSGSLAIYTESKSVLEVVLQWGKQPALDPDAKDSFDPSACWALRRGQTHLINTPTTRLRCEHILKDPFQPSLCVLINAPGETLGVLTLRGAPEQPIESWQPLATTVAERAALAISNLILRERLRQQSIRDSLTGLFNRRYMEQSLDREMRIAARHNRSLILAMIDLDHFKSINDRYGHDAGDLVLQELGHFMTQNFRSEDIICRFAGDEFTLILTEAGLPDAIRRFEKMRLQAQELNVQYQGINLNGFSLSIGLACFPQHGNVPIQLLRAADKALYHAKDLGRNRVIVYDE